MPTSTVAAFFRHTHRMSVLSFLLFLGLAAFLRGGASKGDNSGGVLRVDPAVRSLGMARAGAKIPVTFAVTNTSASAVRLLGIETGCMQWGCVEGTDFPVRIPPSGCIDVTIGFRPPPGASLGPFAGEVKLYSDAPGSERTVLRISGEVAQQ